VKILRELPEDGKPVNHVAEQKAREQEKKQREQDGVIVELAREVEWQDRQGQERRYNGHIPGNTG
jgi:hypothetical protein